jgi:sulfide:quinone oxidoreductase
MPDPVVLVLGCGMAGASAALELRRLLPPPHRVLVIDREPYGYPPQAYLRVATGELRPDSIRRHRSRLSRRGIEFVNAEVRDIDVANNYVRAGSREFHFDYLVVALGAEPALDLRPGLADVAQGFYSLSAAERLAANLRYFAGGKVVVVVNCPPWRRPVVAHEAVMLLEHYFHARRRRQRVEIELCTSEERPLDFAGAEASETVLGLLAHKGIAYRPRMQLAAVDATRREVTFRDGTCTPFDLLVVVPELRAPAVVQEAGLADQAGWMRVEAGTFQSSVRNVFAVGDISSVAWPNGRSLPSTEGLASVQAKAAARNIAFRLAGGRRPPPFQASGRIFVDVGAGAAALVHGDFLARPSQLQFKQPSIVWHWARALQERYWLWRTYG